MITYIDIIPQQDRYETALLIKPSGLKEKELKHHYIDPHNLTNLIAFGLEQGTSKKPSNKLMREHCAEMLPMLQDLGVTYLLVADANYFKLLTGKTSVADTYSYMFDCNLKEFPNFKVVYVVNYAGLFHNPALKSNLDLALSSFTKRLSGDESVLGEDIIHFEEYPETYDEIKTWLTKLHDYPELTCDIEAFSLKHWESGIGTIGFAWTKHEGIAFKVDYFECPFPNEETGYGYQSKNVPVYKLLIDFFDSYKGKLIYHNCNYDIKILIYNLYMDHLLDQKGLLKGLHTLHRDIEDTKLIKYLATNTCALNPLDLKSSAHEYTGKYAQEDINDIRKIPAKELLRYNLIDCLATWFVKEKFTPIMQADKQEKPYRELFLPSAKVINQMQLTGMCLSMPKVLEAEQKLIQDKEDFLSVIMNHPLLAKAVYNLRKRKWEKDYEDRKSKAKNPDKIKWKDFDDIKVEFNPNSGTQLIELLYHQIGLPVIDFTKTKLPATGGDTLEKLINHTSDPEIKTLLSSLISYSKAEKILTSFIPAFKSVPKGADGYHYLFGNFNLGGTKSSRLSSSNVNLQQLPSSGSPYAKLIKACFVAPDNHIFVGADYASLEDRINTLLTKDTNKVKVYTQGFDGHSLRARFYYPDDLGHLDSSDPKEVNTIADIRPDLRQESKAPTFALTYQGTYRTLMTNCGFSEEKALSIESNYHTLYEESDKWMEDKIAIAAKQGYAELAFGIRLRAPILHQTVLGIKRTPTEASAEARTLGNALGGQSYCTLNMRAMNAYMERVWASPYAEVIRPCAQIHDAGYYLIPEDIDVLHHVNTYYIQEMFWQELPEIQHPEITLGGELDIFYGGWHQPITLDNNISKEEIISACIAGAKKYEEK